MADKHKTAELNFPVSLNRFISAAGAASRRKCAELIKNGQVTVNGKIVTAPGNRVEASDLVEVDGNVVSIGKRYYIMLNKPRGYTCTAADPYAEHKAIDLIELPNVRLFSAGRLDKASEGLLIFSNDGDYVDRLTHPKYGIPKTYELTTNQPIATDFLPELLKGIHDAGEVLKAIEFSAIAPCLYKVVLNEGKKREIRRMAKVAGCRTEKLLRTTIGKLKLGNLGSGCWSQLTHQERQASLSSK
ncbi:MAG: rRNA pseudouridine synthase [Victivallaceae bacterium]|nr:rRNA pseudouridine synthase [Victivallaceae bacterium]